MWSVAQYGYRVVAGAFRKYSSAMDDRRQTVDFPLPDDVFGFVAHNLCRPMSRYNIMHSSSQQCVLKTC